MKKLFNGRIGVVLITLVEMLIFARVLQYFTLCPLTLSSPGIWLETLGVLIFGIMIAFVNHLIRDLITDGDDEFSDGFIIVALAVLLLIVLIIVALTGSKLFNAKKYSELITINEGNFEEDIIEVDSDNIVVVDVKTAQRLGDRTAGTIKNASWYDVDDEYNLISINGEEYRISPVNYKGVFSYHKAKESGIPGYVLVNAKTQEAEFVSLEESIKYSPSAFWSYDLSRHIHSQYPTYIFGKSFFEVDDEGTPYWITSVKESKIGVFGGKVITGAVITDAVTGESNYYALSDVPEWVDHVCSVSDLMRLIGYHYKYSEGYFNFSNTNVYRTAYAYRDSKNSDEENDYTPFEGYNSVLSKTGEILFYTGITPANNAESNIGFVLVSPRTGEVTFYSSTGAEESSAQVAAEGLVQNLKYSASFPTIVNVDGVETYFMILKDNAGLVQKYSLCNIANYSKCVVGDTLEETIQKYKVKIGLVQGTTADDDLQSGDGSDSEETIIYETTEVSGTVSNVKEAQIGGYTYYYFYLENSNDTVFMSSINNSNKQPFSLIEGAEVTIEYYDSSEDGIGIVTAISFK